MLSSHLTIHSLASVPLLMRSMKKAGALSAAVLGSVVTAKLYHNHDKERRHKMTELAKPYLPTLKVDLLGEVASTTDKEKKTCVIIGGGVAGIASVRTIPCIAHIIRPSCSCHFYQYDFYLLHTHCSFLRPNCIITLIG